MPTASSGSEVGGTPAGRHIEVRGRVQGVGFRPWVWRVARGLRLHGAVWNHARGVSIDAWGDESALEALLRTLKEQAPAPARVDAVAWEPLQREEPPDFTIERSADRGVRQAEIPADLAPCPDCLRELRDPADRRYRYPFINCTACGPRFTLALSVPWDRPATTMAEFPLCADCAREYEDPKDRRFHAEPVACPRCGPKLRLLDGEGSLLAGGPDALDLLEGLLTDGAIVAVQGVGGFLLACDAANDRAVATLRERKRREEKPFAVMVPDLHAAHDLALISPREAELLTSARRPIVLLRRRPFTGLAPSVAPDSERVGLMLPPTPLHVLIADDTNHPLVMTSGNLSEEPILTEPDEALRRLKGVADAFLVHDRPIANRCDDSVAVVAAGRPTVLRRARGWVPDAVPLARPVARPILACGAQLKNTFCLATGDRAWLGPHIGDLDHPEALAAFEEGIDRLRRFLDVDPEVVAHDLHPSYQSTLWARRQDALLIGVQHHHAHAASCLAEHGRRGPALALVWDGTGFGTDGAAWGGELLLADVAGFRRLATLRPIRLPGGDVATRQIWRLALSLLLDLDRLPHPTEGLPWARAGLLGGPPFDGVPEDRIRAVRGILRDDLHCPPAHGLGRWFDAVASLLLGRGHTSFEGQAAMALEQHASPGPTGPLPFALSTDRDPWELDLRPTADALLDSLEAGVDGRLLAARFHATLVAAGVDLVERAARIHGVLPVVLTGGCFANVRLVEGLLAGLARHELLLHGEVPPGDGGIALGQVLVADARMRGESSWAGRS